LEGERLDHIMTSAIVDVDHIVTTHALAVGDLDMVEVRRSGGDKSGADEDLRADILSAATTASGRSSLRSGQPESSTTRAGCHAEPGVRGSPHR
jgi:hypothetical protein